MAVNYLDPQIRKAILGLEDKVTDISNILRDLSMKICHIIRSQKPYDDIYYDMMQGRNYYDE